MATTCSSLLAWGSSWGFGWGGPSFTIGGPLPSEDPFTDFCVCGSATQQLASFAEVTLTPGDVDHGAPNADGSYRLKSDDGTPSVAFFDKAVGEKSTLEIVFSVEGEAKDLGTTQQAMFVGLYDDALSCAGLFLSPAGIAYGASYDDSPLVIPSSEGLIVPETTYALRIVVDNDVRAVFVYLSDFEYAKQHGPKLKFVLPLLDSLTAPLHEEGAYVAVLGTTYSVEIAIQSICMAPASLVDNFPPTADPGKDVRRLGLAPFRLDGSGSKDPEGGPLSYEWRAVALPPLSAHQSSGQDGRTLASVSGYTDKLYTLHAEAGDDAFSYSAGDILRVGEVLATIVIADSDGDGAFFQVTEEVLPAELSDAPFLLIRQDGFTDATVEKPLYSPDTYGVHRFQLRVSDAAFSSDWTSQITVIQRRETATGVVPDTSHLWTYLSDTWGLLEDAGRIETLWSSVAQVLGGEMLRMLQVAASSSLQTIPRRIVRKWLNYDLLLREPFMELTRCEARFSGAVSEALDSKGLDYEGETLVVYIPGRTDLVTVTIPAGDTPQALATALQTELDSATNGLTVTAQKKAPSSWELLLLAPFPFIVVAGTTALFTVGDASSPLNGTGAERIDAYTLKVGVSLLNRGVKKGDLLSVEGTVVQVKSLQDNSADLYRFQRIQTVEALPPYADSWEILLKCTSPQLNFWGGGVVAGDLAMVSVNGSLMRTPVVGLVEAQPSVFGLTLDESLADLLGAEGSNLYLWGVYRRSYLPIGDEVVSVPTLSVNPWEAREVNILRQHVDYWIDTFRDQKVLAFRSGLFTDGLTTITTPRLWAEDTQLDNSAAIEANFGLTVGLKREDLNEVNNIDYLSAVRGLWFARAKGPRIGNLRIAAQILFGLPFAEERGVVQEIDPNYTQDRGRILLADKANPDNVRSYTYPSTLSVEVNPSTRKTYVVGDEVAQFAPLVEGVSITDNTKNPAWADPYVSQGALSRLETTHLYLVEADVTAFNLSSLLFVSNFLQRISPARTKPLFLVRMRDLTPDTVDVEDALEMTGVLELYESPYTKPFSYPLDDIPNLGEREGSAAMFDQPDPSPPWVLTDPLVGASQSKFDTDIDPATGAPATSDDSTPWGWDTAALSPESLVSAKLSYVHAGGNIPADLEAELRVDQPLMVGETLLYGRSWVPAFGELGYQLGGPVTSVAPLSVDAAELRIVGWPSASTFDYVVKIFVNSVLVSTLEVTHTADGTSRWYWGPSPAGATLPGGGFSVSPGDEVRVGIYATTEERSRQRLRLVSLTLGEGASWTSGGPLAADTYVIHRGLLGCQACGPTPRCASPGAT